MKVAIDLNEVLRKFTPNFAKYYQMCYDHTYDFDNFELWTNELKILFPFKSDRAFENFTYIDFAYELFGCAPAMNNKLSSLFDEWYNNLIHNNESEEPIEFIIVSAMENGLSIPSTMFFLSKFGCKIRECYFPKESEKIWERCDVLISANPLLLGCKPEGKIAIKIKQEYNKDCEADYTFSSMKKFMEDENNIKKLLKKDE